MKRLKILFVTHWYPTHDSPINGIFVREHAKAAQLYCDITVLHLDGSSDCCSWRLEQENDEELTEGIPTWRLLHRKIPIRGISRFFHPGDTFRAFEKLFAHNGQPDVIHAHVFSAGLVAVRIGKRYGIPVVISEHFSVFPRKTLRRRNVKKARLAFQSAKMVLPVSDVLQRAIEYYNIKAQFRIVPNAVDTELFAPDTRTLQDDGPVRLLWVALFGENKGLHYLLRALARLQDTHRNYYLDIIGDGPERANYEQLTLDLGLSDKVEFHGLIEKSEVAEFMRRADIFVLSSLFETFSVVTAEALATGTPVLVTRCGGPEEFVTEDVGMIVPAGDVPAMAEALETMIDRLPSFDRTAIARAANERFSLKAVGKMLQDVYYEVAKPQSNT